MERIFEVEPPNQQARKRYYTYVNDPSSKSLKKIFFLIAKVKLDKLLSKVLDKAVHLRNVVYESVDIRKVLCVPCLLLPIVCQQTNSSDFSLQRLMVGIV